MEEEDKLVVLKPKDESSGSTSSASSSSSSSDATPDHEDVALPGDVGHPTAQYVGNGDIGMETKIEFGLGTGNKEVVDVVKSGVLGNAYIKRKSEEDMSSLESKASTPSAGHPPQAKEASGGVKKTTTTVQGSMGTPWQQLLSLPPQQMLVIERMHSGARRFVVLDFGAPILLTGV